MAFSDKLCSSGVALHQDVAKSTLAVTASAAGSHGHRKFLVGISDNIGTGSQDLKTATLRKC